MMFSPSHVNLASAITVPFATLRKLLLQRLVSCFELRSSYFLLIAEKSYKHFPDGNSLTQYHYEGLFPLHQLHFKKPETLGAISYYFDYCFWLAAQQVELHLPVVKVEVFFSKSQLFIILAWDTHLSILGFISCRSWI